jgi:hypothetical protein
MAWLASSGSAGAASGAGAGAASGATAAGTASAGAGAAGSGWGALASKVADYAKSDAGRNEISNYVQGEGMKASSAAAANSANTAQQGMQYAATGGAAPPAAMAPAGSLPQSGYDPMDIRQRLMAFRG